MSGQNKANEASGAVASLFSGKSVLCDGAMGTMLYASGAFINRCYDELNVTQPETVRSIHDQYLLAGAEVIETNTFGANAFRLEHFGLRDRVRDFNLAAASLARHAVDATREKQGADAFVAGAVGSLGVRLEPAGKVSLAQAKAAYVEQMKALVEGDVDLLLAETMMSIDEAEQAVLAAREVAPSLKIVVLMTVNEDGNCLDGTTPEVAAERLTRIGADAIGCNCSAGPATVLRAIERMRSATTLPLVAKPNAGLPANIEGRHIYLSTPEYMASFARKALRAGATWVGGCCGTTPAHIHAMRGALRAVGVQTAAVDSAKETSVALDVTVEHSVEPPALRERSTIGRRIADGEFVTMVEIVPPKGFDCSKELGGAELLKSFGVHAINVPDSPRASARMSNQALCSQIQQRVGIETILHYTCRDRNILSMQSDLLGAASGGLKNILCLTGDPPKMGNYPTATAVFDVDAIGLTKIVKAMNHGLDIGGNPIGGSTGFTISVAANPGVADIDNEVRRFEYKVAAGAEFCITQPVFDLKLLEQFLRRIEHFRIPVIAGIWPLTSLRNAEFMKNDLKLSVPDEIFTRMGKTSSKEAALTEGVAIAREMLEKARPSVQGAQVSAPFNKFMLAVEVLGLSKETDASKGAA